METTFEIKNFRVFDDKGVSLDFNPITILTGSNSSGKSSAVKAIFLLQNFLYQIKKAVANGEPIQLDKYKLDFTQYPNNLLGRFDKVVNEKSKDNSITIAFSVHSLMLSKEVNVNLVFSPNESDVLNNAYLKSITLSTEDGVFYSSSVTGMSYCNLNILKKDYATFIRTEFAAHKYCDLESTYKLGGGISEEEYNKDVQILINFLRTVEKSRRDDILRYVRISNAEHPFAENKEYCQFLELVNENGFIFSIPLLDELDKLDKGDVASFISDHCLQKATKGLKAATQKVLKVFAESNFDSFASFFHDFELMFLEHVVCTSEPLKVHHSGVQILRASQLSLGNDFFRNPYDTEVIGSIDLNGWVIKDKATIDAEKEEDIKLWEQQELTFNLLYEIVMQWNFSYENSEKMMNQECCPSEKPYVYEEPSFTNPVGSIYHIAYELLTKFAAAVVLEAITPDWGSNLSYVSSSRASVNRLYTLDRNDDFSILLQNYFEKKRIFLDNNKSKSTLNRNDYTPDSFMNSWIEKFEIGKFISLDIDSEGLGVQIRLHNSAKDKGHLLADKGYGITQLISILLQIETAILSAQGERVNRFFGLENLDHYDSDKFHYEVNTIAIEEPEIHLHPKFQSVMADMLVEAMLKYNIHFIVETHSEYLIRKLQLLVSGKLDNEKIDTSQVAIYYINSDNDKAKQKVKRIAICRDGYLDDTFGEGFYDEATRLSRLLM